MGGKKFENSGKFWSIKGISHIEVMLSFLIFIGFIIFALYFFNPVKTSRLVESSMSYVFNDIEKYSSIELESYSVSLENLGSFGNVIFIGWGTPLDNVGVRVENYLGEEIPSKKNGGRIHFEKTKVSYGAGTGGFVKISLSEDIEPYSGSVSDGEDFSGNYEIASSNTVKLISEKKIKILENEYSANYPLLKEKFNLPGRVEFGFSLSIDEAVIVETENKIPENAEIFSDNKKVEVLKGTGEVVFADLAVKIW